MVLVRGFKNLCTASHAHTVPSWLFAAQVRAILLDPSCSGSGMVHRVDNMLVSVCCGPTVVVLSCACPR